MLPSRSRLKGLHQTRPQGLPYNQGLTGEEGQENNGVSLAFIWRLNVWFFLFNYNRFIYIYAFYYNSSLWWCGIKFFRIRFRENSFCDLLIAWWFSFRLPSVIFPVISFSVWCCHTISFAPWIWLTHWVFESKDLTTLA